MAKRKIFESKKQRKYESKDIEDFFEHTPIVRKNTTSKAIPITVT